MALSFHACPPPGSWWNDPNALYFDGKSYQLLAQQRDDAPDFDRVGWGRATSADLLRWHAAGIAVAHDAAGDAYSGSVQRDGDGWSLWHTVNAAEGQYQVRRTIGADGVAGASSKYFGPPRPAWRDPYLVVPPDQDTAWMLIAAPCPWDDDGQSRSTLELYRPDDDGWTLAAQVGPWHPPGILWEVPLLVPDPDVAGHWLLSISLLDRRAGAARCSVRRWRGRFDGSDFRRDDPADDWGMLVDDGPDFYAAMTSVAGGWPSPVPALVGWAASWESARAMDWPGFAGGPISLPREITARGSRPLPAILAAFSIASLTEPVAGLGLAQTAPGPWRLEIIGERSHFTLSVDAAGGWSAERAAPAPFGWRAQGRTLGSGPTALSLFVDGPLVELHLAPDDRWFTCAMPGQGGAPFTVRLYDAAGARALDWRVLP